ncbi:hypothetical protein EYM_07625 [Ignicoccus islandicus DSM 13165]|uniref:SAM-dependent MTase TRM10-type domain-containing protein n=1 Tax=Ignicoccus islandicus DSM 13165 TaxID=940295 RepID=A0A0U3E4F4_9CREN|nr:hypothetical protein [Ignicoccus islandicus]ALU12795.1 hypothetical protein EYM_07625 [Ignicoccus islandicus DSM 13165]
MGNLRPGEALIKVLSDRGINVLASKYNVRNKRFIRDPFQETAVHMLLKGSSIKLGEGIKCKRWFKRCVDEECVWYALRGGTETSDATHQENGEIKVTHIEPLVTEYPRVGIYMGFFDLHTPREQRKLKMQVKESLNAVRTFLWDKHFVLIDLPLNSVIDIKTNFIKLLSIKDIENEDGVILLDPNAERELSITELMSAKYFIFGGIVDKEIPRKGLTSKIPCKVCMRRKITLRGSTIGVPQIVHKLVYALLRARFELQGNIEKAIIEVMSSTEKRWRIAKEMIKAYRQGEDPLKTAIEVAGWLRATCKDVIYAIRMSGLKVDVNEIQAIYCSENGS